MASTHSYPLESERLVEEADIARSSAIVSIEKSKPIGPVIDGRIDHVMSGQNTAVVFGQKYCAISESAPEYPDHHWLQVSRVVRALSPYVKEQTVLADCQPLVMVLILNTRVLEMCGIDDALK